MIRLAVELTTQREGVLYFNGNEVNEKNYGVPKPPVTQDGLVPLLGEDAPTDIRILARAFYESVYSPLGTRVLYYPPNQDRLRDEAFAARLRAAHSSRWSWTRNFDFVSANGKDVVITARFWGNLTVPSVLYEGPDSSGKGRLRREPVNEDMQPNYVHFLGEEALPAGWPPTLRVYWNLGPEGVIPFVAAFSKVFDEAQIPFQFKVFKHPRSMTRPDTVVTYFPCYVAHRLGGLLSRVYGTTFPYLRRGTPPFTRAIGHGISIADDPMNGASFGEHRTQLLAIHVHAALKAGGTLDQRTDAAIASIAAAGYPLDRLHLNPTTAVDYDIDLPRLRLPLEDFA